MTTSRARTAGRRLKADLDAALENASKALGKPLALDEHEVVAIEAACRAADRREILQRRFDEELVGENRSPLLVKISAELRALDRAVAEHVGRVRIGVGVAKSERHQRAVMSRWDRRDWQAAQGGV